jgi:hypothetical protein
MTPEEIEERYGKDVLNMIYDGLVNRPVHELADWILALYSDEEVDTWVKYLKAREEEEK